jgi:hypothetical protein
MQRWLGKTWQSLDWSSKWNKHSVSDFMMSWNLKMSDISILQN